VRLDVTSRNPEVFLFTNSQGTGYAIGNPLKYVDPDGADAIYVEFPKYRIGSGSGSSGYRIGSGIPGLGHAGFVTITSEGKARYAEYGRYDAAGLGLVRGQDVRLPNVQFDASGTPTPASLTAVLEAVSEAAAHGGPVNAAYFYTSDFDTMVMNAYIDSVRALNTNPNRCPYSTYANNCGTFGVDVLRRGGFHDIPNMLGYSPNRMFWNLVPYASFFMQYQKPEEPEKPDPEPDRQPPHPRPCLKNRDGQCVE
jgi:hypothetical protein